MLGPRIGASAIMNGDQQNTATTRSTSEPPPEIQHLHRKNKKKIKRTTDSASRVMHPSELMDCSCTPEAHRPLLWVPEENRPRCFKCVMPIWSISKLSIPERRRLFERRPVEDLLHQRRDDDEAAWYRRRQADLRQLKLKPLSSPAAS